MSPSARLLLVCPEPLNYANSKYATYQSRDVKGNQLQKSSIYNDAGICLDVWAIMLSSVENPNIKWKVFTRYQGATEALSLTLVRGYHRNEHITD